MEWYLVGLLLLAAGAIGWPLLARQNAALAGWLSALVPFSLFIWLCTQTTAISAGQLPEWTGAWVPQLGVNLGFRLDGLGLLLSLLISGIGSLILVYGGAYLKGSAQAGPFFAFVQLFMLAMLGVACADHLLVLFVFWELTSLASYFLIGLAHTDAAARKSALRALLITGTGGLAMLAGILLLHQVAGTFSLAELQTQGAVIKAHALYPAIFVLVVLGAFTKSAQVPFHFWLPEAMAAPTPVSAYLHSATMVKAGVFMLAKLMPVLGGTVLWHDTLTIFGAVTMFLGAVLALAQTDIKRLLAYSTMSALGTLVMLLGIETALAVKAMMVFLVVHALYKAPLFMIAGVVDKAAGTRNITLLHGLGKRLPLVAFAAALAAFSMSGLPPFIGFIGKELLYEAQMDSGSWALYVTILGFAANAINVAVALKVGISPFRNRGEAPEINPKAKRMELLMGPLLLAVAGIGMGLFPQVLGDAVINSAVRDVLQQPGDVHLKLWHGFNLLLLLSALTLVVGVLLYIFRNKVRAFLVFCLSKLPIHAAAAFDAALAWFISAAGAITRGFQHGNLRLYIVVIFASLSGLIIASLASTGLPGSPQSGPVRFLPTGVAVLMAISGIIAIRSRSVVMAVLGMGGIGYGVALLFAFFGAPDLALTQILVETLTLVLFALLMRKLPPLKESRHSSSRRRITDMIIAVIAGGTLTLAMLAVRAAPMPVAERISAYMSEHSLPIAHGGNVVNVILVDFRALDTLGEICVLSIAALGVAGLLLSSRNKRDIGGELAIATPLFRTSVIWLKPLLIFMSLILLCRGHNEPGGGFIGGLVAGAGLVLQRMASAERQPHYPRRALFFIAAGIATAIASTLPSVFLQKPFMEGVWFGKVWLPFVGKSGIGTPFIFDIGVYLVVIGVSLLILTRLIRSEASAPDNMVADNR